MSPYNEILIHTSGLISSYLKSWQDAFENDRRRETCRNQCVWIFLNPFLAGIGLSAYHAARGLFKILELAMQVTKLFLFSLAAVCTCFNIPEINNEWSQTIKVTWLCIEINVNFMGQGMLHLLGTFASNFYPRVGVAMIKAAIDMDLPLNNGKQRDVEKLRIISDEGVVDAAPY